MGEVLYEVVARSALVSLTATLLASLIGITLGTTLAVSHLGRRRWAIAIVNTGMAFPTVVIGLVVALLLWRSGPLGELGLIYTVRGMIIAQVIIAVPIITGITMAALRQLPPDLPEQLRTLGANPIQMVLRLWSEARLALLGAAMAGFGYVISEVGAATIVGGNIHGHTQVMTTAIVENVSRGEFGVALFYGAVLLTLAFVINGLLTSTQKRGVTWAPR